MPAMTEMLTVETVVRPNVKLRSGTSVQAETLRVLQFVIILVAKSLFR